MYKASMLKAVIVYPSITLAMLGYNHIVSDNFAANSPTRTTSHSIMHSEELKYETELEIIDHELDAFAQLHSAVVSSQKTYNDDNERRVVEWKEGSIAKALLITDGRNFRSDSPRWKVFVIAWIFDAKSFEKPMREYVLAYCKDATTLKVKISEILCLAEEKLKNVQLSDLK